MSAKEILTKVFMFVKCYIYVLCDVMTTPPSNPLHPTNERQGACAMSVYDPINTYFFFRFNIFNIKVFFLVNKSLNIFLIYIIE